ncbi:hypothetical protein EJB05_14782, partial [Eragrostis curvula]
MKRHPRRLGPASDRIVHSYKRSLNGFAARLSEQEAQKLSGMEGVVSVFRSKTRKVLTTRSWDFLGFPQTPQEALPLEGDVIVGMLDTGVWPDSPSFSDDGMGPPPSRWKGACINFRCNNKIIGARAYRGGATGMAPVDEEGHGSHTASIVAGRAVDNVSFDGLAAGTARGAVPGARLAIYKVCWQDDGCDDADVLAAFDDAIADGVDVISLSIGGWVPWQYFEDTYAIGSFHAMRRRVLTSAAAGNIVDGDGKFVGNVAPWMLSVAASSIDRRFIDKIALGNGQIIVKTEEGSTIAQQIISSCKPDDLAKGSYKGKIILCPTQDTSIYGSDPPFAGAAGVVVVDDATDKANGLSLPGLAVSQDKFNKILAYVKSTSNPVGAISSTETAANPQAPVAASFSSHGPNLITPGILKPDLSAPGIDILAAWSPLSPPWGSPKTRVIYSIEYGTSMACPHASGAAAYVRSFHRDWSPAMVMSALITTATPMNTSGNAGYSELKYGAGQLNPSKASDPGLVYDASEEDYVAFLCAQGYNATQLALLTGSNSTTCPAGGDLNYPTMAAHVAPGKNFTLGFARTATNVGVPDAVYDVEIIGVSSTRGMEVTVAPERLEFSAQNGTATYTVSVSGVAPPADKVVSMAVVWSDGHHVVRSPLVVYTVSVDMPTEEMAP